MFSVLEPGFSKNEGEARGGCIECEDIGYMYVMSAVCGVVAKVVNEKLLKSLSQLDKPMPGTIVQ